VGPRGGDRLVLGVAAAIEEAFAGDAQRCRPVPNLAKLKSAKPVKEMPGAVGWD
jgi:amidase